MEKTNVGKTIPLFAILFIVVINKLIASYNTRIFISLAIIAFLLIVVLFKVRSKSGNQKKMPLAFAVISLIISLLIFFYFLLTK